MMIPSPMLRKEQIPAPALLVDLDALEANLARMAAHLKLCGKGLRPHAKAHKCVEIARRQLASGAAGICVATAGEAEVMAKAGIGGLLLTSPVADPYKMARIVRTGAMVVVVIADVEIHEHVSLAIGIPRGVHRAGLE